MSRTAGVNAACADATIVMVNSRVECRCFVIWIVSRQSAPMSGLIFLAFAGLLMQEATPHPSSRSAYAAPVIRPFEPGRNFGGEQAQGDAAGELFRRPLEAPVVVEAYNRSYEYTPGDIETAYEQGVTSAEIRADQAAGPLDGSWRIVDGAGRALYELVLNDAGIDPGIDPGIGPVEGGWRGPAGRGAASWDGTTLTLDRSATMTLEREGRGWRGVLAIDGQSRPASLIRPN